MSTTVPLKPQASLTSETEVIQGIAAMSASGQFGKARIAAGIVASSTLGDEGKQPHMQQYLQLANRRLEALANAGKNFRGIRYINTPGFCLGFWRRGIPPLKTRLTTSTASTMNMPVLLAALAVNCIECWCGTRNSGDVGLSVCTSCIRQRLLGGKAEQIPFESEYFKTLMAAMAEKGLVWDCNGTF